MNKTLRDFLAVLLCFCMICSLCGVGFAAVEDVDQVDVVDPPPDPDIESDLDELPPVLEPEPSPELEPSPEPELSPEPEPSPEPTSEPEPDESEAPSEPVLSAPVIVMPAGDSPEITYVELPEDYVIKSSALEDMYAIDPQSALAPVTSSSSSGLKAVMLSILGDYDPIVAEYQYVGSGSYNSYIREIQPDYVWLASAAIFAILLYCTWRLLGGLVCRQ